MKKIALVTGASSGLGRLFVAELAQTYKDNIDEIWIVARREARLQELQASTGFAVKYFVLDLTQKGSLQELEAALKHEKVDVRWLINNAGFGKFGIFDQVERNATLSMIELNIEAQVALCHICLPYMQQGGHIVQVASAAAFLPQPYLNVYGATKRFMLDFSRALAYELKGRGVSVTALCPKLMNTEFLNNPGNDHYAQQMKKFGLEDPSRAVAKVLKAASKNKQLCIPSFDVKVLYFLSRITPVRFGIAVERLLADR